jgi:TetR/AcrR family transcriptional regulator, regulator of biofilm formation and stress response
MANAPARPDRRRLRGEERKTAILAAACAVVARAGAGALTHRAVAAEAGVSLASTSYHFPSIHALRSATFAHAGGHIAGEVTRLSAGITEPRQLGPVAGEFAQRLCRERRVETVAVLELIVAAGYDARLRRLARYFHRHLAAVIAPFLPRPSEAPEVAAAMHGLVLVALTSAGTARSKGAEFARTATTHLIARYQQGAPR